MSTEKEIRDLFERNGVPLGRNDVWAVQQARVVKHKALERLAAALKIRFDEPRVLRAERDEAVMLVIGHLPTGTTEWSVGECVVNVNYRVSGKQAAYVWAMAEKRAKDRVILKLAGLHGAYSEDEADDFREPPEDDVPLYQKIELAFQNAQSQITLHELAEGYKTDIASLPLDQSAKLRNLYAVRHKALAPRSEAA